MELSEINTEQQGYSVENETDMWDIFKTFKSLDTLDLNKELDEISVTSDPDDDIALDFCQDCKTNTLIYGDGFYICSNCGEYQQKKLSEDAEYRFYGESDNKNTNPERVGMPTNILLPESSLGSLIGYRPYDTNNFKKMIQYNSWNAMPYKERSQWKVFSKITTKARTGGLPNIIIEDAKAYYKIISETSISRGSNREGLIAACVYMACKKEKVPRSTKEISDMFSIQLQDMTRGCKRFKEIWRLSKRNTNNIKIRTSNPLDYIDRFCSNLQLATNLKHISEYVAVKAIASVNNLVEDNTSPSVAAGSIFLVCMITNQSITKKQVSVACKISEVTISKCYKKLNKHNKALLPKEVIQKYNV